MILYTVVSAAEIFAGHNPTNEQASQGVPAAVCQLSAPDGSVLLGRKTEQGFAVDRLISTDPFLYLEGRYAPGSLLPPSAVK